MGNQNIPLVSVVVPTRNSEQFLEACLKSIRAQTHKNIELVVVDRFSVDGTPEIAKRYADKYYEIGPERSAQRNMGVERSNGKYVAIIDSDMELSEGVIADCVEKMESNAKAAEVIIPEESFGKGFWAQCKRLERSFYVGVDWIEAARFFKRADYIKLGGYNEQLTSGEDWDLSARMKKLGETERIRSFIFHNEGRISLTKALKKKYYYAGEIKHYLHANSDTTSVEGQMGLVAKRFKLYLSEPRRLLRNPFIGIGMLFMKVNEYAWGYLGFLRSNVK